MGSITELPGAGGGGLEDDMSHDLGRAAGHCEGRAVMFEEAPKDKTIHLMRKGLGRA